MRWIEYHKQKQLHSTDAHQNAKKKTKKATEKYSPCD